jgi:homoserine dehydrogenase
MVESMRISIIGFGVVGKGVADVIHMKRGYFKRMGVDIDIVAVVDLWGACVDENGLGKRALNDLDRFTEGESKRPSGTRPKRENIVDMTGLDVIREVDHDVVVETTPTNITTGEPGLGHMTAALESGKHVVTSNKGPLALHYRELIDLARKKNVKIRFEATVGGAMPIINLIRDNLAGNEVIGIKGIFNGTCNYILSRMAEERLSYEHVLSEAIELGIAETNPSYDVDGIDTACKLVILANAIFCMDSTYKDVDVVGIRRITSESLGLARNTGYVVKLIGEVGSGKMCVAPRLVPMGHPLDIGGTLNAASIQTDLAGEIIVMGKGAGAMEASSSIVSDLMSICI